MYKKNLQKFCPNYRENFLVSKIKHDAFQKNNAALIHESSQYDSEIKSLSHGISKMWSDFSCASTAIGHEQNLCNSYIYPVNKYISNLLD